MEWHTVSDSEVLSLRISLSTFWCASRDWYKWFFEWVLGRKLTLDETSSIFGRINGFGPCRFEDTGEAVDRPIATANFWRNQDGC